MNVSLYSGDEESRGYCSFCHKSYKEVGPLVEAPDHIYICYHCAELCVKMLESRQDRRAKKPSDSLLAETREQIKTMVEEIRQSLKQASNPEEFYEGFLQRTVGCLAAHGGAIWFLNSKEQLSLQFHWDAEATSSTKRKEIEAEHQELVDQVFSRGEPTLVQPYDNDEFALPRGMSARNPTNFLLLFGFIKQGGENLGLVEIFQRVGQRPAVERGYLRFVMQMCDLATDFHKRSEGSV